MNKIVNFTLIILMLLISVNIVVAQSGSSVEIENNRFFDDFDDGDVSEYSFFWINEPSTYDNKIHEPRDEGGRNVSPPYALRMYADATESSDTEDLIFGLNNSEPISLKGNFNVSWAWWTVCHNPQGVSGTVIDDHYTQINITDNNGTSLWLRQEGCPGGNPNMELIIGGSMVSQTVITTLDAGSQSNGNFSLEINETHIKVYQNEGLRGTFSKIQNFTNRDNMNVLIEIKGDSHDAGYEYAISGYYDNILLESKGFGKILRLEVKKYMEHNSTQKYKVFLNDSGSETDVTDSANVTSQNTSVITVNDSRNELISTDDTSINQKVEIKAESDGVSTSENVTVANATMENIGILPNTKWLTTFAGVNDAGLEYGLGSEIQWIFFIILMMVTTTHIAQSKWVGLGTGEILLILFWLTEFIGLGVFLGSMIFGIFMILTQMGRNDQNVTIQQPPNNDF